MRHAFLIMAYNEIWLLKKLVTFLSNPNCDIYMNIDKKTVLSDEDLLWLKSSESVKAISRHTNHWGGRDMVKCELALMELALHESKADYFHLLSGQDYPIKPLSEFLSFFERNKGKNFLSCEEADFKTIWRRLLLFQPLDWYDERGKFGGWLTFNLRTLQTKLGVFRSPHGLPTTIFVGSQWFSISRKACKFVIRYTRGNGSFLKRLRHTYVSDETYINTVLMDYYREEEIDNKDNLRFIRWENENGNNPSNLGLEHFALLASSSSFFARKLTQKYGFELVGKIDTFLLDDAPCRKWNRDFNEKLGLVLLDTFETLGVNSCLVVGDNMLYVQALLGNSMDVNGLYPSHDTLAFLQAIGLEELCQWTDFSQPVGIDAEERFEALLLINQALHHGDEFLLKILNSATNLANKYVLIIEEETLHERNCDIVNMAKSLDFTICKELNALLTFSLEKAKVDASIFLLTKK